MLVPIRVGMIRVWLPYPDKLGTCPHTRGDDPAENVSLVFL